LQLPAVVVRIRLLDEQQLPRAGEQRPPAARAKLDHPCVAVQVGVVDVEAVVERVLRAERNRQQPTLATARDARPDVEEGSRDSATDEIANPPGLLDDVETLRLAGGECDVRRRVEPRGIRGERRA
jgi:hypothetical protein